MKILYPIMAFTLFVLFGGSCSKDKEPGPDGNGSLGSQLSMKVEGKPREASVAQIMSIRDEDSENYLVTINAFFTSAGYTENDEVNDMLSFTILFTEAQFNNPKGTYDIIALNHDPEGRALVHVLYQVEVGGDNHRMYSIPEANTSVGKLTITDFAIGNRTGIPGVSGRGYSKLQGTFQMNLTQVNFDGSGFAGELKITDGKFNATPLLGF